MSLKKPSQANRLNHNYMDDKKIKIATWNINGLRSGFEKFKEFLLTEQPDIICLQEIKVDDARLPVSYKNLLGYRSYWCHAQKPGYSGVAVYSKIEPDKISLGVGIEKFDREGRAISLKFKDFTLVNLYFPHSGRTLERLDYKTDFNEAITDFAAKLKNQKTVLTGDFNVAHDEIDLARPKDNKKNAGFTPIERKWFDDLVKGGWSDIYRDLYPDKKEYTWWSQRQGVRARNIGWRIDYFLLSPKMQKHADDCTIKTGVYGSDHAPVLLYLK